MRPLRAALAACIVLVTTAAVRAQECVFLPHPGPIEHTQPDGTRIEMFRRGDAFRHWLVDARGNALVETDTGVRYARLGADGAFEATGELAGPSGPKDASVARNVVPSRAAGLRRPSQPGAKAGAFGTSAARGGGAAFVGGTGTVRNLVLLLRFSNHGPSGQNRTLPSVANVTTIMNAPGGHATLAPTGSVRDHYLETSYGQFTIDSTVVGWLDMPNTETYYANNNSGQTQVTWQLIAAGLAAADPLVDFDQFDQDGDGWIDAITILHSGYGAEFLGVDQYGTDYTDRMWSHKWAIPTWTSAEGVRVSDYNISPGLWATSGSAPGRIGVVCHELGHFFGLPDLYDTDGSSEGDGNWCLMAAGSWGFNNTQRYPSHLSAWGKIKLGWVMPTTLLPGAQSLPRVESNAAIHKIDSGYAPGEYLLIENRQQFGFDSVIPQGGLAIWHVDEAKGRLGDNNTNNTEGFPGQPSWPTNGNHYRNALVQADALFDLEHGNDRGDAGDVFRSGGVSQLLSTGPNLNTDAYQPGFAFDNGNQITGISASSATMTYTFGNATTPPVITTASLPAGGLGVPYSTTLASSGGTAPKTWSEHRASPGYALTDLGTQSFPLGGTARNWRADDNVWALDLPFAFPYWETQYTRVHVSSNGTIDLSPAQSEWRNRPDWLRFALRIAPLWDDLRTDTAGKDIFTDTTVPGQVRIRWAASHADTGVAVNFAVMLFADGRIRFEYGTGNTNLTPTVGMSRGEGGLNVIPSTHDGHANLANAHGLLFTLQGSQIPPGLTLSSAGVLSGTPTQVGTWVLRPRVTDAIWRYDQRALTVNIAGGDSDGDGVPDGSDNCPSVPNSSQSNADGDSAGDACDTCTDTDGDGFGNPGFPANTCPPDGCPNDPLKSAPGVCGCGVAETDTDGDGTPNCNDGCPNDPLKIVPGLCGCGVPDTDSDGDGTPNCTDGCPNDPLKIAAGQCGCGVPDTDSDGDGTANCNDGCPNDPNKTAPGACGCGVPETDSDGDGTPNCADGCPNDPLKIAPGICGCGVPDTDSDGDGTANCNDGCPNDPNKTAPGLCGCGTPDTDSDGDGTPNCTDGCPNDPLKLAPGVCGCGVPDTDSDGDGTANCNDGCPNDPSKTAPGACGCGVPETDGDGDGTPDCTDGCPSDPLKIAAGQCGCGVPDTDSDGDGTANCNDGCPNDPGKTSPGLCGCGTPDTDSDGDGTPNCTDGCPNDPLKLLPGICGCGVPDTDSDGDGTANCNDGCPNDPLKLAPGLCGCGTPDTDSDGDGTPNCTDGCPSDPLKIAAGQCGCGVPDTDSDSDGTANCNDGCPNDPGKTAPGACGCGVPDTDTDGDGIADCNDNCDAIQNPGQADCDANGIGDACEIAAGAPDCNQNAIPDACDIANGTSLDADQNGVPDECSGALTPFCFGDGSGTACPCGNTSLPADQSGCLNSLGTGGRLVGAGSTSVTADTLVLSGTAMPNSSALYFQGTGQAGGGAGAVFGDGLRCPAGGVVRLGTKTNAAGASQYPAAGDAPVSVRGAIPPTGGTRHYQVWYRNAANFCTSSTFNLTNGLTAVWVP